MAKLDITDEPQLLTGLSAGNLIIQNEGPGDVYMDSQENVSEDSGFKIAAGGVYETSGSGGYSTVYLMTDTSATCRVVSI